MGSRITFNTLLLSIASVINAQVFKNPTSVISCNNYGDCTLNCGEGPTEPYVGCSFSDAIGRGRVQLLNNDNFVATCTGTDSCKELIIEATNVTNIEMTFDGKYSGSYVRLYVYGEASQTVTIYCRGDIGACLFLEVYSAEPNLNVTVYSEYESALNAGIISGIYYASNRLSVHIKTLTYACYSDGDQ